MKDSLDHPINQGDIVVQCAAQWGLNVYRVRKDPNTTKRLHVHDLWGRWDKAIAKEPKFFLNMSAIFGDALDDAEIERRLTELYQA